MLQNSKHGPFQLFFRCVTAIRLQLFFFFLLNFLTFPFNHLRYFLFSTVNKILFLFVCFFDIFKLLHSVLFTFYTTCFHRETESLTFLCSEGYRTRAGRTGRLLLVLSKSWVLYRTHLLL